MERIAQYRAEILQALQAAVGKDGQPRFTEQQATALANEFSDEELLDGIDFNTPQEVAEMLMEAGLA